MLEKVDLSHNRLTEVSPLAFHKLEKLTRLSMAGNRLRLVVELSFIQGSNELYAINFLRLKISKMVKM